MKFIAEYVKWLVFQIFSCFDAIKFWKRKSDRPTWRSRKQNLKGKYRGYAPVHLEDGQCVDEEVSLSGEGSVFRMHRPHLQDRFGTLRFRIEMLAKRQVLMVTIIDAWDLPPMDSNGKADPYIEVSLRPGGKKYTTSIKTNSLNPTFNETAELPLKLEDMEDKDLVLKVMDSDYPLQDELIGVIRLPVLSLDLDKPSRQYTCLILHEKRKNGETMGTADAAKLNLKISQQAEELYEMKIKCRETKDKLESLREEYSTLRSEKIELEMENFRFEAIEEKEQSSTMLQVEKPRHSTSSAPVSKGASPTLERSRQDEGSNKSFQLLSHLQVTLVEKDKEIAKLRSHIREMKPRLELMSSRNGQIDVGLSFYHITSRLRIDLLSAHNLRAVNMYGKDSDPYAKVKVFRHNREGKVQRWKYETQVVWKTLSPVWKERFILDADVSVEDLPHMHLEITVMDKGRFRTDQPLGKVFIGPNQTDDGQHWEEMLRQHGEIVKMTHALRDA